MQGGMHLGTVVQSEAPSYHYLLMMAVEHLTLSFPPALPCCWSVVMELFVSDLVAQPRRYGKSPAGHWNASPAKRHWCSCYPDAFGGAPNVPLTRKAEAEERIQPGVWALSGSVLVKMHHLLLKPNLTFAGSPWAFRTAHLSYITSCVSIIW